MINNTNQVSGYPGAAHWDESRASRVVWKRQDTRCVSDRAGNVHRNAKIRRAPAGCSDHR